jgi:hypothetical protein
MLSCISKTISKLRASFLFFLHSRTPLIISPRMENNFNSLFCRTLDNLENRQPRTQAFLVKKDYERIQTNIYRSGARTEHPCALAQSTTDLYIFVWILS